MTGPVIYGLSNEAYHHEAPFSEYLSSSQLKLYLKSPKAAKFALDNPTDEKSDALRFGSLFHDLMACMAEHNGDWDAVKHWRFHYAVFEPPLNPKGQPFGKTTKAYLEAYANFEKENADLIIATQEELNLAHDMCHSLWCKSGATSEQVCKLLKWAKEVETSYFYETEDGIKLKVRPDLMTRDKIVDWKTTNLDTLDEDNIAKAIIKYRYDVSLSMYQYVVHEITGKWYKPILVFVQKTEPHDAIMADISEWCYQYDEIDDFVKPGVGAMEFRKLLDLHTECVRNNEWPGAESTIEADGNTRIMKPSVPYWLGMKYFEEF